MEIRRQGFERRDLHRAVREIASDESVVPVDLHVRANAHMMIGRRKLPGEVYDDRLVLAGRETEIGDRCTPPALRVSHLEGRRGELDRGLLPKRYIDTGVGRIDPASEEEIGVRSA